MGIFKCHVSLLEGIQLIPFLASWLENGRWNTTDGERSILIDFFGFNHA